MTVNDWNAVMPQWVHDLTVQGILITDADLVIRGWNRWLEIHTGHNAASVIGCRLDDVYPDLTTRHLDHYYRQALAGQVIVLAQRLHHYLLPMPPSEDQGVFEHMQQSARIGPLLADGQIVGTITVIDDVTERVANEEELKRLLTQERAARIEAERAADRTARLQAATAAFSESLTAAQVATVLLEQSMAALDARGGFVALLRDGDAELEVVSTAGSAQELISVWHWLPLARSTPLTDAVRTGEPIWLESPEQREAQYPDLAGMDSRSGAWAAIPLIVEGRAVGGVDLNFPEARVFSDDDRSFLLTLVRQCGQALERAHLYEAEWSARSAAEHAQEHLAFLADASTILAVSLDAVTILNSMGRLLVPRVADFCMLHLVEADSQFRQMAIAHVDQQKEHLVDTLAQTYRVGTDSLHCVLAHVVRTGQSLLVPELTEDYVQSLNSDPEILRLFHALGPLSYMIVPLVARDRVIGTATLAVSESGRHYDAADLSLVEDLARRCALAVDNARLYQAAQSAIRVRDQFLSIASHELKTPLTSLLGFAELLERRALKDSSFPQRDLRTVRIIVEQASRLTKMISAMLDISRIEMGQLSITRAPFDLCDLVRRVVAEAQPALVRHTILCDHLEDALMVEADELRMEQVVQNLLQNAIKYSPNGGVIDVRVTRCDGMACLEITDQGIGIPQAALPLLFQRFYRAGNAVTKHISGMGIGLYVVKEIVTLHGGTVNVKSIEGLGTTFTIALPMAKTTMSFMESPAVPQQSRASE